MGLRGFLHRVSGCALMCSNTRKHAPKADRNSPYRGIAPHCAYFSHGVALVWSTMSNTARDGSSMASTTLPRCKVDVRYIKRERCRALYPSPSHVLPLP